MTNNKGVTLVELLLTLTILLVISSIILSVLIGINKNYKDISRENNLHQEANIIFSTIKNYHLRYENYQIRYENGNYYIGSPNPNYILGNDDSIYLEITIDNVILLSKKTTLTDKIIVPVDTAEAINITIGFKDQNESESIETIIMRY